MNPTFKQFSVRAIRQEDYAQWLPLWLGYNEFYGRVGATALPEEITAATWERFFNPHEPVHGLVAVNEDGQVVGLVHYLFHRSTTRLNHVCYLQDLFTAHDQEAAVLGDCSFKLFMTQPKKPRAAAFTGPRKQAMRPAALCMTKLPST